MSTPIPKGGGEESPKSAEGSSGRSSDEFFLVDVPSSTFHQRAAVEPAQAAPPRAAHASTPSPKRSPKKKKSTSKGDNVAETDDTSEITRILANPSPTDGRSAFTSGDDSELDTEEHKTLYSDSSESIDISSGRMDRLPARRDSDDLKELFTDSEPSCKDHPLIRVLCVFGLIAFVIATFAWNRKHFFPTVPGTDTFPSLKYSDGTEIQPQCYANAMQGVVMSDQIDEETKLLIDMNITHPEQCCTECIKLEKCMAYSYYNASHPSDSGKGDPVCLLHSKIVQTSAKPGWFYVLKDSIASDSDTKDPSTSTTVTEAPKGTDKEGTVTEAPKGTDAEGTVTEAPKGTDKEGAEGTGTPVTEAPGGTDKEGTGALKNRIAMLIPFLGNGFSQHVKSAVIPTLRGNADLIDFYIIADNGTDFGQTEGNVIVKYLPDNGVRRMFHQWTLDNLQINMTERIGPKFWGWRYKIVDFKPMYGSVFKDWIKEDEYSHWGYCDLDVVYGKISLFITQDMLDEYDAMAVEDVRRKAWMMNGPFSLYRNNEFGREHWTKIDREVLVSKLTNPHVSYVDEQTSSPPIITDAHASFAFVFGALQGNWISYPNWTISWDEADGHLIWRPDPDLSEKEKNVKEGPITDIKPNIGIQTKMKKDSVLQWGNGSPYGSTNPSFGFNYYLRTRVEDDPTMTWRAKRIDHERVFRTDLGEATYELAFMHFYRLALGREFNLASKTLKVNFTESDHPAKKFQIKWNGLSRGHDLPKPAHDMWFTELEFSDFTPAAGDKLNTETPP